MNATTFVIALLTLFVGAAAGFVVGQQRAQRSRTDLREELKALSAQAVSDSTQQVLDLSSRAVSNSTQQVLAHAESRAVATEQVVRPVRESLDRLNDRLQRLEALRRVVAVPAQAAGRVRHLSGDELRRETRALAEALRRPQVRGNWGEMQLRRSLELSGLDRALHVRRAGLARAPTTACCDPTSS